MSEPTDGKSWVKPERYLQLDVDHAERKAARSPGRIERAGKRPKPNRPDPRPNLFDDLEQAAGDVPLWRRASRAVEGLLIGLAAKLRR